MCVLVLAERRPLVQSLLREIIRSDDKIELTDELPSTFVCRPDLDALVLNSWSAHERYGGVAQPGVSQVLGTRGDLYAPRWVVTRPSFALHLEFDVRGEVKAVKDNPNLSPEEETYIVFSKIFQAVEQFNVIAGSSKIRKLGYDLAFSRIPLERDEAGMKRELESILRAYQEHVTRCGDVDGF